MFPFTRAFNELPSIRAICGILLLSVCLVDIPFAHSGGTVPALLQRKPEQCRDREGDERFGQRGTGAPTDLPMVGGRWRLLTAAGHLCLQIDVDHVGRLVVVHRRHIDHVRARIGDQVGVNVSTLVHRFPVARDVATVRFRLDALGDEKNGGELKHRIKKSLIHNSSGGREGG